MEWIDGWLCEQLLHGEQYTEVFKPLSAHDNLISSAHVADILDKGTGAVVIINSTILNSFLHLFTRYINNNNHSRSSNNNNDLGHRIGSISSDDKEWQLLFQRLLIALQRFNAILLHAGLGFCPGKKYFCQDSGKNRQKLEHTKLYRNTPIGVINEIFLYWML